MDDMNDWGEGTSDAVVTEDFDVFLNHRGLGVKVTFEEHLEDALRDAGLRPFLDARSLMKCNPALQSVDQALDKAKVHVAVVSSGYVESKHCLNELVAMMRSGKPVVPVFYGVEPADLRSVEDGPFAQAFERHKSKGRSEKKMQEWREALAALAGITGFRLADYRSDESKLQREVVNQVAYLIASHIPVEVDPCRVGLQGPASSCIQVLEEMGAGLGILGLVGMGGIGKTTLAREIYSYFGGQTKFRHMSFLEIRRDNPAPSSNVQVGPTWSRELQKQLLWDLLRVETSGSMGYSNWFRKVSTVGPVMIVVDNVHNLEQFETLIPSAADLHPGSRIILTSRYRSILYKVGRSARVDVDHSIFDVALLDSHDSNMLFNWHAFRAKEAPKDFRDLAEDVVAACGGLPLALKVLASKVIGLSLFEKGSRGERETIWVEARDALRQSKDVMDVLRWSYDILCDEEQRMFVDIACLFNNKSRDEALSFWRMCKHCVSCGGMDTPHISLQNLIDKNLVSCDEGAYLKVHDLLVELGEEIGELTKTHFIKGNIGEAALTRKEGSTKTRALNLRESRKHKFDVEEFANMPNLHFLELPNGGMMNGDWRCMPQELRWLRWRNAFLTHVPLGCSNLVQLDLNHCVSIIELPDSFGQLQQLQHLNLQGCTSIIELPDSFGQLQQLQHLNLQGCRSIIELPNSFGLLQQLRHLNLQGCTRLKKLPEPFRQLQQLQHLNLQGCTSIIELPDSFGQLQQLQHLNLQGCTSIVELPNSFGLLQQLLHLNLQGCTFIIELPDSFELLHHLQHLNLKGCTRLKKLPWHFGQLRQLQHLNLQGCTRLKKFPESFGQLKQLQQLDLGNCRSLKALPGIILVDSLQKCLEENQVFMNELVDANQRESNSQRTSRESSLNLMLKDSRIASTKVLENQRHIISALYVCETLVRECKKLLPVVRTFRQQCKNFVESLEAKAINIFEECHRALDVLKRLEVDGGGVLSRTLSNSAHFCFESLFGLAQKLQLVVDLFRKCASENLPKTALELANLPPPPLMPKRWSEYSLTFQNYEWNMDLVEFAFHTFEKLLVGSPDIFEGVSFKWCEEKSRVVLQIQDKLGGQDKMPERSLLGVRKLEREDLADLTIGEKNIGMLVMELMDQDLRTVIDARIQKCPGSAPFATNVAVDIILQIAQAMWFFRDHEVLHRNLKARSIHVKIIELLNPGGVVNTGSISDVSNVLLHTQENFVVKIIDFDFAEGPPQLSWLHTGMDEAAGWRAPEVYLTHEYKWPADVYSFAITCYEILTGKLPFSNLSKDEIRLAVIAGLRPEGLDEIDIPNLLKELIQKCWAEHPIERPTFEEIVKSLWECRVEAIVPVFKRLITSNSNLIQDKLVIDLTKDLLGVSSSGYVIRTSCSDGQPCVLKRIDSKDNESDLVRLNHPHVVQLIDYWIEERYLFLVMELMDGDLAKLMSRTKKARTSPFSLHVTVDLMLQIAKGMLYLHEMSVSHPHLKCENVLYKLTVNKTEAFEVGDVVIKLGGFGYSRPANVNSRNRDVLCFGQTCLEILTGGERSGMDVSRLSIPDTTPAILKECIVSCLDTSTTFSDVVRVLLRAKLYIQQNCKDEMMCLSESIQTEIVPAKRESGLEEIFTVHQLHPQEGGVSSSVRATLIFFHGFHKVPEEWRRTWMTRDNKHVWPQKWLPEDLGAEKIRVLSLSFDANSNVSNKYNRHELGKNLVERLILSPRWKLGKIGEAIFLVGHSFGGVLIKYLVTEARRFMRERVHNNVDEEAMECEKFLKSLATIVFYSVPHSASAAQEFEGYISGCRKIVALQRSSFLQSLGEDTRFIADMNQLSTNFASAVSENVKILAFLEGKPMSMKRVLVTEKSCEGLSSSCETWQKIDKDNHFEVCRPDSKSHIGYRILLEHLQEHMDAPCGLTSTIDFEVKGPSFRAIVIALVAIGRFKRLVRNSEVMNKSMDPSRITKIFASLQGEKQSKEGKGAGGEGGDGIGGRRGEDRNNLQVEIREIKKWGTSSYRWEVYVEICCSKCFDNVEEVAYTTRGVSQVSINRWKSQLTFFETPFGIIDRKKFVKRLKKAIHEKKAEVLAPWAPAERERPKGPKPTQNFGRQVPRPPSAPTSSSPFIPNPSYLQHPVRCHQCSGYPDVVCANCGRNSS